MKNEGQNSDNDILFLFFSLFLLMKFQKNTNEKNDKPMLINIIFLDKLFYKKLRKNGKLS